MPLDTAPRNLSDRCREAETLSRRHTECLETMVRAYVGSAYRQDYGVDYPENFPLEFTSLVLPRIVHENPRVSVGEADADIRSLTGMLRVGLNRLVQTQLMRRRLIRIGHDFSLAAGYGLVTYEARQYGAEMRMLPMLRRISPRCVGCDPLARSWEDAGWYYWVEEYRPDELVAKAERENASGQGYQWDMNAVKAAPTEAPGAMKRVEAGRLTDEKIVTLYHVFVPGDEHPESPGAAEGFNGTRFCVFGSQAQGAVMDNYAKAPAPFFGPARGPLYQFGAYPVMDSPYPLSPIAAVWSQVDALNQAAINCNVGARRYKRIVLYPAAFKEAIDKMAAASDTMFVPVPGLEKQYVLPVEIGGITAQLVDHLSMQRERLDRASGIHEPQRGNATPDTTATVAAIADQNSSGRIAFMKGQFHESTTDVLRAMAHYLVYGRGVRIPLGSDAARELNMLAPVYAGGPGNMPPGIVDIDELDVAIEPYSMERVSEQQLQRQSTLLLEIGTKFYPIMAANPGADWKGLIDQVGNANNFPRLSRFFPTLVAGGVPLAPGMAPGLGMGGGLVPNAGMGTGLPGNMAAGMLAKVGA